MLQIKDKNTRRNKIVSTFFKDLMNNTNLFKTLPLVH